MNDLTLTTKHLLLRGFAKDDWQAVHEYASDPEVVRYVEWGPNTEEETRDFIERSMASYIREPRRNYQFAVMVKEEDKLIGGCGLQV